MEATTNTYDEIKPEIAKARADNAAAEFDYLTPAGDKAARSHVFRLRALKGAVEKRRKEAKADVLERGRAIDGEAKALAASLDTMIEPHAEAIKKAESAEAERVARLEDRLAWFTRATATVDEEGEPWGSNYLANMLGMVQSMVVDGKWQEFEQRAHEAKAAAIATLERHVETAIARERDAEDLARLRQAEAEAKAREDEARRAQERADAEARAKREAAEREAREIEEAHQRELKAAEDAAREEREAADREAQRAIKEAQDRADQLEREAAEREAREAADRAAAEALQQEERKRQEDLGHRARVRAEIAAALAEAAELSVVDSELVADLLVAGMIPHVSVAF